MPKQLDSKNPLSAPNPYSAANHRRNGPRQLPNGDFQSAAEGCLAVLQWALFTCQTEHLALPTSSCQVVGEEDEMVFTQQVICTPKRRIVRQDTNTLHGQRDRLID